MSDRDHEDYHRKYAEKQEAIARLTNEIENGRTGEIGDFLLQHLAEYGTEGIDAQALAIRINERINEEG